MHRRHRDYGNTLSKSLYASVGAGLILYETSIDLLKDVLDAGRIAPEEGRRIVDDVADRLEQDDVYDRGERGERRYHRHDGRGEYATKRDIDDLKSELSKINQRLSMKSAETHAPEV